MMEMLANLIDNVRLHGLERVFKRYYSIYRGQVISNTDPTKRGLISVKVPNLFGDKTLPDLAIPKDHRNAGAQTGEFYPPEPGDWVFVEFEGGDQRFPNYTGGWHGNGELNPLFAYVNGVPVVRGYVDTFGNYLIYDQTPGKEAVTLSNKDQSIVMNRAGLTASDRNGNSMAMSSAGITVTAKGNQNINVSGDCNLNVSGTCTVKGATIILNSRGSGITTANSHMGVIDLITGAPVMPSPTTFGDV